MSRALAYGLGLSALLLMISVGSERRPLFTPPEGHLKCMIPAQDAVFHRSLVMKFAQDLNLDIRVQTGDWPLDSLRSGALDLMIVSSPADSLHRGVLLSRALADGSVWAVRESEAEGLRRINLWLTELTASERFNRMQRRYLAGKSVSLTVISPYDHLLRSVADSLGWDWRLLAAVVYNESRFNNDASSGKGALGLMQIRSSRYTPEQLYNPALNLSVGSRYLHRLEGQFPAADPMERMKFALAAYNLGEGKVGRLIVRADSLGLDCSRWNEVARLLPAGHHTVSYVDDVLDTYAYYSRVYPR